MSGAATAEGARRHELILASAGSGKTWQLTTRFLALLADGVPAERVLATTFTRKAAGEIFERLLGRLARAATDERELAELNAALERGAERALDRAACLALLAAVVRRLDRFQVRTLDAVFAELAGVFGLDVGLPPGWEVVEEVEDAALRAEAVGAALASAPAAELAELLTGLHGERPRRSVHERVMQAVKDGYALWLERKDDEAWTRAIRLPAALKPAEEAALPARIEALVIPLKKDGEPRVNHGKARATMLADFRARDWKNLIEGGPVGKVVEGSNSYDRVPMDEEWLTVAQALARHAGRQLGSRLLGRSRAHRDLLRRFDAEYQRLQRERRAYRFDDLPRALAKAELDLGGQGAALRAGRRVEHLLLDEFQDTSVLQWRVLAPLARALQADEPDRRSFFCVGDVKQAIYAWREGESRLLLGLKEQAGERVKVTPLHESFRSSRPVLDFVNEVFARLPDNPALDAKRPELRGAAEAWGENFATHKPSEKRPAPPGAARLIEVPMSADGPARPERTAQLMAAAARHVAELARVAPAATIAVLLRRAAPAAPLLYHLRSLGVPASGEGGNPLVDSDSVRLALSLLQLAAHPGDGAALFHLAHSPLAGPLGLPAGAASGQLAVSALAARVRAELDEQGHGEWLAAIERHVLACDEFDAWERRRFRQLVELGLRWDSRPARAGDFLAHVQATRVDDPSTARVRVMTIHAAKGLEFDAVVLPDLEDDLLGRENELVGWRPDPEGPLTEIFPRPSEALARLLDGLSETCERARARRLDESLCVLYVALTRARRRLDVLVPSSVRAMHRATFAGLLRHALLGAEPFPEPGEGGVLWTAPGSVEEWFAPPARAPRTPAPAASPAALAQPSPAAPPALVWSPSAPRTLPRRSPSRLEGGGRVTAAELLSLAGDAARGRGVLVHRWLEELEWLEDFAAGDDTLLAAGAEVAREAGLSVADQRALLAELRGWLLRPATRGLLLRQAARPRLGLPEHATLSVQRERRFAVPDVDALLVGSMDRVVLAVVDGAPVGAEIVDYKTDHIATGSTGEAAALDKAVERYRPQMQAYRRALCVLTGLAPERVACRLLFLELDVVRDV